MPTVGFFTLGCKVNQQETTALAAKFKEAGFKEVGFAKPADVYVINSCAVTADAEDKSLIVARRKKRQQEQSFVVLAGCFPQVALDRARDAGVDLIVGSNNKARIVELVTMSLSGRTGPLVHVSEWSSDTGFEVISETSSIERKRATLKVQDGCEQYCAYCIIPYARGPERSLPIAQVLSQARHLTTRGFKELVLSGIHLGAYGRDFSPQSSLASLVTELTQIPGVKRVRLGSIEPNDLDGDIMKLLSQNKKLCNHVHVPLQSGSDTVLKRMNRRYTTRDYCELVAQLRALVPGIGLTTDLIVGFPGESEEEFKETMDFLSAMEFSRLHVFRYSRRSGTPAAEMKDQVPEHIKDTRFKQAQTLAEASALEFHRSLIGKTVEVLVESEQKGRLVGHTGSYAKVLIEVIPGLSGKLVGVEINGASSEGVYGQPVKDFVTH